jgi:hypothetical protein
MHQTFYRACASIVACLLLASPWASPASVQAADNTTFSGQATVIRAAVTGLQPMVFSDTGPLPSEGGAKEESLLTASVPGLLTAEVLHAATIGQGNAARSEASVASLSLTVGGSAVAADFLMARAAATCGSSGASVSGSSEIAGLVIDGQSVVVSGQPNQTIALPAGTGQVIINEQTSSTRGNSADITVNALHVIVTGVADVIVSSAHADITCRGGCGTQDFVTGGGWITPSGAKANFGVAGGIKQGAFWGHLTYIDHGTGMKVKGTGVTAYTVTGPTSRHIEGTAEINGASGTYKVDVADNGEPGRSDTISISLSTGYSATRSLAGGNIQLHKPC